MIEFLYSIDVAVFRFINGTIANPVGDFLWPLITDYDKLLPVRILLVGVCFWLLIKGGIRGRTVVVLLIPLIFLSDQMSSTVIKGLVNRPRPCHVIDGVQVVQGIHQLVDCGGGKSFPSSHAVNNFAIATLFAYYYRRGKWWLYGWASLVALSRPAVGVHYPSDILAGAVIGTALALLLLYLWAAIQRRYFPRLAVIHPTSPKG